MYKVRLLIPFILILFIFSGCSEDDSDVKTMAGLNVVIESGETYRFVVTTGVEEDAVIVKHPVNDYEISEYKKDSLTTNGIYTYKPIPGFTGVEDVEIEKYYFASDSVPQLSRASMKITITVKKGFAENNPLIRE